MKYFKCIFLFALLGFATQHVNAQSAKKQVVEVEFKVEGVCGMCEERIENALSVKGVKLADWDMESKICKVIYNSAKINEDRLHELLNEVGHDTERKTASEEQYEQMHHCCQYRSQNAGETP